MYELFRIISIVMNITATDLSNDLKHIHIQKKDSQATTVIFMVGVGSRYEDEKISGISHYLEHMFFKGTTKRKNSNEIAEYIEEIGGSFNAFTSKEYTGYYAMVAKKHTERAFDFVSDLVINATFPEDEMEKEKGVVIEEMNMYEDMPMHSVPENFEELLYGDTPLGRKIIGNKKSVTDLTHKEVTDYVATHYTTQNSVVVSVGPESAEDSLARAEQHFSPLASGEKSTYKDAQVNGTGPAVLLGTKKTDQTHLRIGFPTIGLSSKDRYTASLVASVLGSGMSSRLFNEIREKRGLCYYVSAHQDSFSDAGYFVIQAGVDNTKVEEAVSAMVQELKKIKENGITEKELKKVKELRKGSLSLSLEGSQELAIFMAQQYAVLGTIDTIEDRCTKINAVTLEDTQRFIDTYFIEDQIRFALIGPFEDEEKFKKLLTL